LIGCISRDFDIIIPSGETEIHIGDRVIIFSKIMIFVISMIFGKLDILTVTIKNEQEGKVK